jgi:uncharacterized protein YjbJ (UPF0337 family)
MRCCCICYSPESTLVRAQTLRTTNGPRRVASRGETVSKKDRASNRAQDAKGRVKEAAGSVTGNRDLENKGKTDQAKAEMKKNLEDAGYKVQDAVTP